MLKQEKKICTDLYSCRTEVTPRKVMHLDNTEQIYKERFMFKEKKIAVEKEYHVRNQSVINKLL